MAYGAIKLDTIIFDNGGSDQSVTVSGLFNSTSGNLTVTGTVSGAVIRGGTSISGATITGTAGQFGTLTGNTAGFTTVTGATVTGTTANFVNGTFTTLVSGSTVRGTFISGNTVTGGTGQFTTVTGSTAGFTTITGATITGKTANFVSGVFTTQVSGATVLGTTVSGNNITGGTAQFTTLTGGTAGFTAVTVGAGVTSPASGTKLDVSGSYVGNVATVSALNIDCTSGNYFTKTIAADSTFTVSNVPASGRSYGMTLEVTHTSGTITWFSGVEWPASSAPTLTTGKTHLFIFITDDGGTRWRGASLVDYVN